jgi:hypothetical protein
MFHLAACPAWLSGMFVGCAQITLLRLAVSAESLRRKNSAIGRPRARVASPIRSPSATSAEDIHAPARQAAKDSPVC